MNQPLDLQLLLDEVQEDEIVDVLVDTNEVGMLLNAIAADNESEIESMLSILKSKAVTIREQLADKHRSPYK